ncbi:MAG TPA: TIGR04086 family membrane protein [Bacillota bacterium]|nr:TIGR04086 family membrane protein [Peptococcaceae bacterium MAG4]NLW37338.1 TIGR04086 family membrane protein [Peptococcaceae bacterium]HPZ43812.1 TIGR04086 family membrane protein [Bacillota bacterium]HQD76314.1 TIGR04086 family membrane protein [Bacillota bacterium]HUM59016.1 TIGR04086 family membrane protein [Bacillota bacterium]
MPSINKNNIKGTVNIPALIQGTIITVAVSLLLSAGAGAVYYLAPITEQTLPWSTAAILAVSTFSGSLVAGKKAGNRGLYHGLAIGALFFLAVWLTSGLFMPGQTVLGVFPKLLVSLTAGAAGGVLGVGFS